ncbi:DUF4142 domain-containing protein [Prosthecomicrobium pneumaticum]|uniref:Putative membrane protein n=1 Tax=Prosthecomicrobium pneumaticum TaxID=81895 RepID=A0A7W9CUB9_9HYPH|nr:DUF4142 domain-containing protein [Prosthecomicrobium pneumaticum]MBB5751779.1 putative membrane protein [Prosthecomicrobium pneumaticum]
MAFGRLLLGLGLIGLGVSTMRPSRPPDTREGRFVRRAGRINATIVEAARLAAERTTREDLRGFANALVEGHTDVGNRLEAVLASTGLTRPGRPLRDVERARLAALREATDFEAAFIRLVIAEHLKLLTLLADHAGEGREPALLAFAEEAMPKLADHYEHARILQRDLRSRA